MGVGLVIVAAAGQQESLAEAMAPFGVWELGRVVAGNAAVVLQGDAA
jgi:phosphoribosylaminoimidazole (AIR) synthetase